MTFAIVFLSGLAALFVGWSLGPALLGTYEKIAKKVQESAKRSEEQNRKDNKYYSTIGIPIYDEKRNGKKNDRYFFAITAVFFLSLALSLITNLSIFWKITALSLLVMVWKSVLESLNPFKKADK